MQTIKQEHNQDVGFQENEKDEKQEKEEKEEKEIEDKNNSI